MQKEFITYTQALALKELGFDEPCFAVYYNTKEFKTYTGAWVKFNSKFDGRGVISAPLYQQAFRWFRENHNLKTYIIPIEYLDGTQETYQWNVFNECHSGVEQLTYEEAESACLDKLIEIVKKT